MTQSADNPRHEHLRQLAHDAQNCLHALGMGVEILKRRRSESEIAELHDTMERERRKAADLIRQMLHTALEQSD